MKEGDLESSKFVTIGKGTLLRKLFKIGNWTDKEVINVYGDNFTVNIAKKILDVEMKYLQPTMLRQLCEKKGIHFDERVSYLSVCRSTLQDPQACSL